MSDDGRPVLDSVNMVVRDMEAAAAFYRLLGLEIPDADPWSADHRSAVQPGGIDFDLDSTTFAAVWDQGWPAGAPGAVIGFRLADREAVDRTYAALTGAGHRGQQPPYDAFWGARYAIVEDPDGNAVGLMSPSDPARRTPPPA
jgi:catechol 2,3-dioxygenase-like lactoylglutathione lyase family enzyme